MISVMPTALDEWNLGFLIPGLKPPGYNMFHAYGIDWCKK